MMIFFSQRMAIEKMFHEWCEEHMITEKPNALVAFMESKGWLNNDAIHRDVPMRMSLENEINNYRKEK